MDYYLDAIKKYIVTSGRASRKEYWMFVLFNVIIMFFVSLIDSFLGSPTNKSGDGILSRVYEVFIFLPTVAITVRRLHDIGKSGWWFLISIIPVIGWIVMLVYTLRVGDSGNNEYGLPSGSNIDLNKY